MLNYFSSKDVYSGIININSTKYLRPIIVFKTIIVINLVLILISLFSGAFFLANDGSHQNRIFTSLLLRISLSITLLLLLIFGYNFGLINPMQ